MAAPFVLVQLSDPHLGATWGGGDTHERLAGVVAWILEHGPKPDAVVVTGDVADHGTDEEYEQARDRLSPLASPFFVLPGNHDERGAMRRQFDFPGAADDPIAAAFDLGPLRLVVIDSNRPGEELGELDSERLAWLAETLAERPHQPTVLAMHHPPVVTGFAAWDQMLLPTADRQAFGAVVQAHPQVLRIVAGHVHRPMTGTLGGRTVLAAPSTFVQAELDEELNVSLSGDPPGYVVHAVSGAEITSFVQYVS
jgi:3',5'-cyclic AMP phosphodiesterase CpdA